VTVAIPRGLELEVAGLCVEAMSTSLATGKSGVFDESSEKALLELTEARDVVALGPGLGREPWTGVLARSLAAGVERPLVIDADGLFALSGALESLRDRRAPTVLTPHPGEAARLLDCESAGVNGDRLGAARRLAERSGSVVVLKGAGTVVAEPSGRALVIPTGGPLLATGGTGDVLTGVVAALLGSGMPAFEAAGLAAWWHGAAADRRTAEQGVAFGLLASELADALPATAAALGPRRAGQGIAGGEQDGGGHAGLAMRFPGL
jgi:NAD(P)H-hydrate epimerase